MIKKFKEIIYSKELKYDIENLLLEMKEINNKISNMNDKINSIYYLSEISDMERKNRFELIYKNNNWGNGESKSGEGSNLEATIDLRKHILDIIKKYNINIFLDAPCGDMNWMKEILFCINNYIGVDIVSDIIEYNKKMFSNLNNVSFMCIDILKDKLPKSDLIFCRDCLQHLSNIEVKFFIKNLKKSSSKYLLVSSHNNESNENREINIYREAKPLNLEKAPFNFPKPIEYVEEGTFDQYIGHDRRMALWDISNLPDIDI